LSKNDTVLGGSRLGAAELAAELVGIGLPPPAAGIIAVEVGKLKDDRGALDAQGENEVVEEVVSTYGAAELQAEAEPEEPEPELEKTYITGAEMGTWDEDDVAAWLTASARLGAPELAAALSVELEGADLVEATDAMLKGLCKKVINHWP
jgi:hypothetical protein